MRVLISAGWLGGAGGAERALHSVIRALAEDQVDLVVREHLDGPFAVVGQNVRVHSLLNWRWRASARSSGLKGTVIQKALNPIRRALLPDYDVYLQFRAGPSLGSAARAKVRLLVPSGNSIDPDLASSFDFVALQAPDNAAFAPPGMPTVLLPPPLYELSETSERPDVPLSDTFYLTVFNPYGPVKGAGDLARAADEAPHPIVWCHSQQTVAFRIPDRLKNHPNVVHVIDSTPSQLRYLYENCLAYLSFSKSEGFGWSIADGLRYAPNVVGRPIGILSDSRALGSGVHLVEDLSRFDWLLVEHRTAASHQPLDWADARHFRERLHSLAQGGGSSPIGGGDGI